MISENTSISSTQDLLSFFDKKSMKNINKNKAIHQIYIHVRNLGSQKLRRNQAQILSLFASGQNRWDNLLQITDDKTVHQITQAMNKKSTKKLNIEFYRCKNITNKGFKLLSVKIFQSKLQILDLNFSHCYGIKSEGLKFLSESLKRLNLIHTLNINWTGFYRLSDQGLKYISEALERLISLKNFSLRFLESIEITDQGLKYIGQALQKLIFLNSINLQFFCSPKITDQGVKDITQGLKKLVSLQIIVLSFAECQQVTDDSLENLDQILPSYLNTISLDFSYCRITDHGLDHSSQFLNNNNTLNTVHLNFSQFVYSKPHLYYYYYSKKMSRNHR